MYQTNQTKEYIDEKNDISPIFLHFGFFVQSNLVSTGYVDNLILLHSKGTFLVIYIVSGSIQTLKCHVL